MTMPGGGTFKTQPGQFTDDSELAAMLMEGLASVDTKRALPAQTESLITRITANYVDWLESNPFDIGYTTKAAMCQWRRVAESTYLEWEEKDVTPQEKREVFAKVIKNVENSNDTSQSNSSLMRIAPLAFFIANGSNCEEM